MHTMEYKQLTEFIATTQLLVNYSSAKENQGMLWNVVGTYCSFSPLFCFCVLYKLKNKTGKAWERGCTV